MCLQYLVVDHHMDGTMCGVGGELTQVESLIHNSLSSKSSVTMNQDGHYLEKSHHSNISLMQIYIYSTKHKKKPPCTRNNNFYLLSLSVSSVELLSFGLALNHWIHCLQVGGVRHE